MVFQQKRVDSFHDMLNKNRFDDVLVDADQADNLIKAMDMFVILLEDGNENDFKILEANEGEIKLPKPTETIEIKNDDEKRFITIWNTSLTR